MVEALPGEGLSCLGQSWRRLKSDGVVYSFSLSNKYAAECKMSSIVFAVPDVAIPCCAISPSSGHLEQRITLTRSRSIQRAATHFDTNVSRSSGSRKARRLLLTFLMCFCAIRMRILVTDKSGKGLPVVTGCQEI